METLSVKLAALLGKPVRPPSPQGVLYYVQSSMDVRQVVGSPVRSSHLSRTDSRTAQGTDAASMDSSTSFKWFKCPVHGTWLQPECKPFCHWKCAASSGCTFVKAAKMRTAIERRLFATHRAMGQDG